MLPVDVDSPDFDIDDPSLRFDCARCKRNVPWSEGGADQSPNSCARCWSFHNRARVLGARSLWRGLRARRWRRPTAQARRERAR